MSGGVEHTASVDQSVGQEFGGGEEEVKASSGTYINGHVAQGSRKGEERRARCPMRRAATRRGASVCNASMQGPQHNRATEILHTQEHATQMQPHPLVPRSPGQRARQIAGEHAPGRDPRSIARASCKRADMASPLFGSRLFCAKKRATSDVCSFGRGRRELDRFAGRAAQLRASRLPSPLAVVEWCGSEGAGMCPWLKTGESGGGEPAGRPQLVEGRGVRARVCSLLRFAVAVDDCCVQARAIAA